MRLLLPPSETKRDGGDADAPLHLARLSFPGLTPARRIALRELRALARNVTTMTAALRLGPSQRGEVLRNREVTRSPTMPALDRFTGVLYDALAADRFTSPQRDAAERMLLVHSALFGLLGAADPVPAYRLSHDSRLPSVRLRTLWREPVSHEVAALPGLVLDLRSDAYSALGPVPDDGERHFVVRVVSDGPDGAVRPLNHFNKQGKGEFARAVVEAGFDHPDVGSLLSWAPSRGIRLTRRGPAELQLVVEH